MVPFMDQDIQMLEMTHPCIDEHGMMRCFPLQVSFQKLIGPGRLFANALYMYKYHPSAARGRENLPQSRIHVCDVVD
jgi:hypothetical protein